MIREKSKKELIRGRRSKLLIGGFKLAHLINGYANRSSFNELCGIQMLLQKLLSLVPGPRVVPTLFGFNMIVHPDFDRALYTRGVYERGTLYIMGKVLSKSDVFIDIGAYIGLMSLFAAKAVGPGGEVHCFEPEPHIFAILSKNVIMNSLNNVRTNQYALGSAQGVAKLFNNLDVSAGASSLIKKNAQKEEDGIEVAVDTLDRYLEKQSLKKIKMIKVDVEGYELETLKGAANVLSRKDPPVLCVEYSLDNPIMGDPRDLYRYIRIVNEYKVFRLENTKEAIGRLIEIKEEKDLPKHDNLFCLHPVHITNLPMDLCFG